jgi:hypothetical protein
MKAGTKIHKVPRGCISISGLLREWHLASRWRIDVIAELERQGLSAQKGGGSGQYKTVNGQRFLIPIMYYKKSEVSSYREAVLEKLREIVRSRGRPNGKPNSVGKAKKTPKPKTPPLSEKFTKPVSTPPLPPPVLAPANGSASSDALIAINFKERESLVFTVDEARDVHRRLSQLFKSVG